MISRIAFPSLAVGLIGLAMALTPQTAEARGHGGFHGGGFHGGGFRGGFYGGGFGRGFYGGGFGRGFYGGGIYASRGFYGGYRGFYPRFYGGFYPGYYGGFYPRYYGSYYMSPRYYGAGYGGYGYGGGYAPAYGGCTCANYGVNNGGYLTTSLGGPSAVPLTGPALRPNAGTSNPLLAYYLKNNPYSTPQPRSATIVNVDNSTPKDQLPMEDPYAKYLPAVLTEKASLPLPPTPLL